MSPETREQIAHDLRVLTTELLTVRPLEPGRLLVVGCSTSEISDAKIGSAPDPELGVALMDVLLDVTTEYGVALAAQCCEHLNRALVMELSEARARGYTRVHAVPVPKAGGSFATVAYAAFDAPCLVAQVAADYGLDIGDTFIGMHLRPVAVPVRLSLRTLGAAHVTAARSRLPFVGGARAVYDDTLL